jgi:hypothetical protein
MNHITGGMRMKRGFAVILVSLTLLAVAAIADAATPVDAAGLGNVTTVPEPGSLLAFLSGLFGFFGFVARRRR